MITTKGKNQSKPFLIDEVFRPHHHKPAETCEQIRTESPAKPVHSEKAINKSTPSRADHHASFSPQNAFYPPKIVHVYRQKYIDIPQHIYQHVYQDVVADRENSDKHKGSGYQPALNHWW
ncbi:hypothetical protein QS257_12980 [Terrilactibacillus sp. S3-3]|nr:hypothetical protein QS257_12980 [Terrilactibacillus sp. S3-3]